MAKSIEYKPILSKIIYIKIYWIKIYFQNIYLIYVTEEQTCKCLALNLKFPSQVQGRQYSFIIVSLVKLQAFVF